jgi:phospholipase/carboxylesterase
MEGKDLGFVHSYVPAQHGEQRVLLLLHGTGGDETSLLPLGRELAPDAALLSPRGKVLERGAPRFFRRLAEGVFDLADLRYRTHELAAFIQRAAGVYGFDPCRLIVAGYSNGANMAASLLLTHPELFGAAILFRAMMPFEPEALPDLHGKDVYLAAGRRDPLVAPQVVTRLSTLLQAAGAQVVLRWQETEHGLAPEEIVEARAWLDTAAEAGSREGEGSAAQREK